MSADKQEQDGDNLTRREAAALDKAAVDSLLLAAGLTWNEIIEVRRKLRCLVITEA